MTEKVCPSDRCITTDARSKATVPSRFERLSRAAPSCVRWLINKNSTQQLRVDALPALCGQRQLHACHTQRTPWQAEDGRLHQLTFSNGSIASIGYLPANSDLCVICSGRSMSRCLDDISDDTSRQHTITPFTYLTSMISLQPRRRL